MKTFEEITAYTPAPHCRGVERDRSLFYAGYCSAFRDVEEAIDLDYWIGITEHVCRNETPIGGCLACALQRVQELA